MSERPLVIKFGGTSVGGGAEFMRSAKIAAEAASEANRPVAVVVSAMSGTTDTLIGYAAMTAGMTGSTRTSTGATRERSMSELHGTLAERYLKAAREAVSNELLPALERRLLGLLEKLVKVLGEPGVSADSRRDAAAVFGERLSAEIMAAAIESLGTPSAVVEETPIATDDRFGEAEVNAEETRKRSSTYVAPILDQGSVAVVPGYAGSAPCGSPTTLGRGGSDLSATALGRALGSREVWILSDVDGVLDADPRLIPSPGLVPELSYREAAIFAGLGARILHPKTMEPAEASGVEVRVGNTFNPGCAGTSITGREAGAGVRCVALRRNLTFEIPCSSGGRGEAAMVVCIGAPEEEDLARGRRVLLREGIPFLHAGFARVGLVFAVRNESGQRALRALHGALLDAEVFADAEGVA